MNLKNCCKRIFTTLAHSFTSRFICGECYLVARLACENKWRYCPGVFSLPAVWRELRYSSLLQPPSLTLPRRAREQHICTPTCSDCCAQKPHCFSWRRRLLDPRPPTPPPRPQGSRLGSRLELESRSNPSDTWGGPHGVGGEKGGQQASSEGWDVGIVKHSWSPGCSWVQGLGWVVLLDWTCLSLPCLHNQLTFKYPHVAYSLLENKVLNVNLHIK